MGWSACRLVLAGLWRGATSRAEQKFLGELQENHPVFTAAELNWIESGRVLIEIDDDHGLQSQKLRDLRLDVLIALTARSYGARLITSNRAGFGPIRDYRDFKLEVW